MSKIMTITIMSNRAMKKVKMNFLMMYLSIFFNPVSIFYNLALILFTVASFHDEKSPASICALAWRTRSR